MDLSIQIFTKFYFKKFLLNIAYLIIPDLKNSNYKNITNK